MTKFDPNVVEAAELRQKAEALKKKNPSIPVSTLSESEILKLIHELEVHQIELELQNQELIQAKQRETELVSKNEEQCLVSAVEITGRVLRENDLEKVTAMLLQINSAKDFRECVSALIISLQDLSGCEAVGIRLNDGDDYPYFETIGFPADFVRSEKHLCAYNAKGKIVRDGTGNPVLECMCGNIICRRFDSTRPFFTANGSFWTNSTTALLASTTEADRQSRTRNRCNGEGYESVALIPLHLEHKVLGLLQFNDHKPNCFSPKLIARLEKIANNLTLSLSERYTNELIRTSEMKFRTALDFTYDWEYWQDENLKIVYISPSCQRISGYSPDEFISNPSLLVDILHPDDRNLFKIHLDNDFLFDHNNDVGKLEFRIKNKNGSEVNIEHICRTVFDENGIYVGRRVSNRDITERKLAEDKIKESEEKYRLIVENIGEGFGFVNVEEQFLLANKSAELIFGVEPDGLVGKNLFQFLSEDQLNKVNEETTIRKQGIQSTYELDILRPNVEKRTIHVTAVPQKHADGNFIGTYGIFRDITERKQMEKAILESEMKYRELVENSPDAIAIYADGTIVYANSECVRLMASSGTGELIGKSILEFVHPDYRLILMNRMKNAAPQGMVLPLIEEKFIRFDGSEIDVEVKAMSVKFENVQAVQLIIRDITARKKAEADIRFHSEIMKNITEAIYLVRMEDGIIVYTNSQFENMFGYGPGEMLGKQVSIVNSPFEKNPEKSAREILNSLAEKGFWNGEVCNIRKDGTIFWSSARVSVFEHSQYGKVLIDVHEDISERKKHVQEIAQMNAELQKLNESKDKFFSIIAHDLKGPFNGFLGLTKIMAEEMDTFTTEEVQRMAVSLEKSASNLFCLLENLLHWARMKQGLIPFNPIGIQLLAIINESVAFLFEQAKIKGIDITVDISADISVFADINMLQSIIRNLVSNALKFTHKGGKVTITASTGDDNKVVVAIKDTGIGMSSEMVDNLFRLDVQTGRRGTNGESSSGLGLLLCKEFIENSGGKIWVESEEGKGSTFSFTIPGKAQS